MARHSEIEPTKATALTIHDREVEALRSELWPADFAEAKPVLAQLFSLPMQDGANDEALKASYRMAVSEHPLWAIKEAVAGFLRGRLGNGFCPNSAELGKELDRITGDKRARWARASRMAKEAKEFASDGERQPISEETRAMVARRLEELRAVSNEQRAVLSRKTGPDLTPYYKHKDEAPGFSRPLTPEDVKDIPDAPPRARKTAFEPVGKFMPFGGKR